MWWRAFGLAQLVLALVAVLGLGWLVVLVVLGWLALPDVSTPSLGPVPYPLLMFVGGVVLGIALAALARYLAVVGSRRRGQLIRSRLLEAVSGVAAERIVAPVRAVLARHRETREALDRAVA
jgi:hypothetical protein